MAPQKLSFGKGFFVLACLIAGHVLIHASPSNADDGLVPGSRYTSARGAAMGGAFLPLGEDGAAALFYNPADIGKFRSTKFEEVNLDLQMNNGLTSNLGFNSYNATSLSGIAPTLQANPGQWMGTGLSLVPSFYMKGFAFGVLLQDRLMAQSDANGNIHYRSLYQLIPSAGTGIRLADGIVRIGYSVQWVNEAVGDLTAANGSALGYNQGLAQGSAISNNVGFALTLPIQYLPQLDLVARNIGSASYSTVSLLPIASNSSGAPATEQMTLDSSISIQPKIARGTYMNLVLEYRDMTNVSGVPFMGRLAMGTELSFRDQFFLRGGYGSGYPSAGFGIKRNDGEISLTWYSEEVGTSYQSDRDVRYLVQYQLRAF